jgi:hypothetical protein
MFSVSVIVNDNNCKEITRTELVVQWRNIEYIA